MRHRRDIDGLRAVAVTPVVLFHAGMPGFSGGYVGVDVFFVISGFLITGILLRDRDHRSPGLIRFYDRRIRRIFPALFAMLAVVTAAAAALVLPSELATYARTLVATVTFVSNVLFWRSSGYFAPAAADNPLLHTWSLAVEEQFYILFPLALWLVYRLRASRYLTLMLALAGVGSLLLAGVLSPRNPVFSFYLLPTRGWELLLGGILASYAGGVPGGRAGREIAGWGGLAMIAAAVVLFTPDTPVPGFPALLPCVGAALLLWAGREGEHSAGRLLSNRVFVGIGLISYSLYLWHWPLLVIPRLYLLRPLTGWETAASILAGVALAALSWRFVEQPFRQGGSRPWRFSREQRSIATGIGLIAASTMVAALLWTGAPQRLPRQVAELDRWSTLKPTGLPCADPRTQGRTPRCVLDPAQTGTPKVVLWGDSHAAQYLTALEPLVRSRGGELRDATSPGCPPFPGVTPIRAGRADAECMKRNQQVLASILADPSVQSVVIAGRWARYFFPLSDPEAARLLVGGKEQPSSRALETSLEATVRALTDRNIKVVLIGQAPEFDLPLPECLAKTAWRRLPESRCKFKIQTLPRGPQHVALAAVLARNPEVAYLDPTRPLCSREGCTRHLGTAPVSWDADHLSPAGAATVIAGFPVDSLPAGNVSRNKPSQGFSRPRLRHSL